MFFFSKSQSFIQEFGKVVNATMCANVKKYCSLITPSLKNFSKTQFAQDIKFLLEYQKVLVRIFKVI